MTWQEFAVSRRFLHEEGPGAAQRAIVKEIADREDAIFAQNKRKVLQVTKARGA